MAGLRAQLQLQLATGELPDWAKVRSPGPRRSPMPTAGCGGSTKPSRTRETLGPSAAGPRQADARAEARAAPAPGAKPELASTTPTLPGRLVGVRGRPPLSIAAGRRRMWLSRNPCARP